MSEKIILISSTIPPLGMALQGIDVSVVKSVPFQPCQDVSSPWLLCYFRESLATAAGPYISGSTCLASPNGED